MCPAKTASLSATHRHLLLFGAATMACALSPEGFSEEDDNNDDSQTIHTSSDVGETGSVIGAAASGVAAATTGGGGGAATAASTTSSASAHAFPQGFPEIRTKSIERTLIPLVQQITTLVNAKERSFCSDRTLRAISRVGQSVNIAVERFVTVGEAIADDSDEIRPQMYAACQEARAAGTTIEKLCEYNGEGLDGRHVPRAISDRAAMVRAARCLLAAVTRVLLLADSVVVRQLLLAKDKVVNTLTRLESVTNFTEFVKAFSQFGTEMVELAQLTGDRQADLKDERRRSQMGAARHVLERSTMMLLTSAKTCLRHPESISARENRDTVFCQMRRAMDLIHYVVKDGVVDSAASLVACPGATQPNRNPKEDEWDGNLSVSSSLQRFLDQVEVTKMTFVGPQARQQLPATLEFILERIQDFTDSAYTTHEHRENILLLCDRVRLQLNQLLRVGLLHHEQKDSPSNELEQAIDGTIKSVYELRAQLQETSLQQASEMISSSKEASDVVAVLRNTALTTDADRLEEVAENFTEHLEHSQEVCKLLRHISPTDSLHVQAKYGEINLKIYGPQVVVAARTLCSNPTSKIAKENLEVFIDMWQSLMDDVAALANEIAEVCRTRALTKPVYMSLPRPGSCVPPAQQNHYPVTPNPEPPPPPPPAVITPSQTQAVVPAGQPPPPQQPPQLQQTGALPVEDAADVAYSKHGTTQKSVKATKLDTEEQAKIAKSGLEMKLITSDLEAEAEKWGEENFNDENNDIVRRAKNMSNMAYNMYQFTRGEGPLKTTQDLFTQAEYFAEEANRLYKVIRQFSYTVPTSTEKKQLLEKVDEIPTRVQQLQFTVKNPTVGKAATFTKVDSVIQETKLLMTVISKVVTTCFECASKYSLDFRGLSPRGRNSPYRTDADDVAGGAGGSESKPGGGTSSDGSM